MTKTFRPVMYAVLSLAIATALVTGCGSDDDTPPAPVAKAEKVRVLAFNDFHGHLEKGSNALTLTDPADATKTVSVRTGGGAFLAGKIKELRAGNPNTIVVSSGDLIGGSPLVSAFFRDEPTIELMNSIGIDINAVGNHEFDKGVNELKRIVGGGCNTDTSDPNLSSCASASKTFAGSKFSFLAANVEGSDGKPIYSPYIVKTVGTQKIGFIGVVTRTTPTIVAPAGVTGIRFTDEATTINRYVTELKSQGVKAIVAVVHEGGTTDSTWNDTACANARGEIFTIADKLDREVDIVLSGHTHQGYNCVRNGMRIMQSFAFGRGIAQLDFEIGVDGNITASTMTAANVPVVNDSNTDAAIIAKFPPVAADAAAKKIVDDYVALAAPKSNREIGTISATIDRTASPGGDHPAGRLIADAQLDATASGSTGNAQIAFMNPGGVRADFTCTAPPCAVTFGQAFTVQPFGNSLVVMTLTGQQIKDLLEQQWTGANATRPRILQPSKGFTYSWDNNAAAGAKVSAMTLNGTAINLTTSYRVTVNSFLADGGDGFTTLIAGTNRLGGAQDIDALIAFFAKNRPYAVDSIARITRLN
ncbi:MAG: bifunctional metallophosphatase/5'-nucleotidase [Casimicrobium sp.]